MKNARKLILLVCLIALVSLTSFAQKRGYEKTISIGVAPDIAYNEMFSYFKFTNGYRFNKNIFLGGGIGLTAAEYNEDYIRIDSYNQYGYQEVEPSTQVVVPVFGTFKVNFTRTRVSPFFMFDLGYMFGSTSEDDINTSGAFFNPTFGCDFNSKDGKRALFVRTGLMVQDNQNMLNDDGDITARAKVTLEFGFRF